VATTITRYINTGASDGGDGTTRNLTGGTAAYQSLDIAQTAEAKDITLATGTDEIFLFRCAGGADNDQCVFSTSWGLSATNYLIVEADDGEMHDGVIDDTKYHYTHTGSDGGMTHQGGLGKIIIRNLQFYPATSSNPGRRCVSLYTNTSYANGVQIENCLFDGSRLSGNNSAAIICGASSPSPVAIRNCVFVDWDMQQSNTFTVDVWSSNSVWKIYNCTFDHCTVGIGSGSTSGQPLVKNCLFSQCTDDWDQSNATGNNNASTKGSSVGTSPRVSQTFDFVDESGNDFRLTANDTGAQGFGADLSGDADNPVTEDFEGDARDASTPCIGFDEVIVVAPELVQPTGAAMTMAANDAVNAEMIYLPDNASVEMVMGAGVTDTAGPFDPVLVQPTGAEMTMGAGTAAADTGVPSPGDADFPGSRGRRRRRGWV
jgi:hypothetical protein